MKQWYVFLYSDTYQHINIAEKYTKYINAESNENDYHYYSGFFCYFFNKQ